MTVRFWSLVDICATKSHVRFDRATGGCSASRHALSGAIEHRAKRQTAVAQ